MKAVIVAIAVAVLLAGIVTPGDPAPKLEGSLKEILVKGSPWEVAFERLDAGSRGRFNQTFTENPDGSLTTKTDEVGPYETSVRFAEDGKSATWTSPHSNLIKMSIRWNEVYGEGRGGSLRLSYKSKRGQASDAGSQHAQREHRMALVIGNATYTESPLNNPANDARGTAQALRAQGFEVIELVNADLRGMRRGVAQFGERLREGGVGLFYYSGHGMQVNGRNYLIPVGAQIPSEGYVSAETLDVDSVLGQMDAARSRINVVILDACRNNPFARRFRSPTRGLAFMQAPLGTFIAYATSPGDVADDGEPGGYGVFTAELLKAMREPLKIEDVFKRVGFAVQERTKRRQTPWVASNLTGDFAFASAATATVAPPAPRPPIVKEEIAKESRQTEPRHDQPRTETASIKPDRPQAPAIGPSWLLGVWEGSHSNSAIASDRTRFEFLHVADGTVSWRMNRNWTPRGGSSQWVEAEGRVDTIDAAEAHLTGTYTKNSRAGGLGGDLKYTLRRTDSATIQGSVLGVQGVLINVELKKRNQ